MIFEFIKLTNNNSNRLHFLRLHLIHCMQSLNVENSQLYKH